MFGAATMPSRTSDDALPAERGEEQEVPDPDITLPLLPGDIRPDEHSEARERAGAGWRKRAALLSL